MRSHPRLLQSKKERLCSLLAPVGMKARHLSGYIHEGTTSPELLSQFAIFSFVCLFFIYLLKASQCCLCSRGEKNPFYPGEITMHGEEPLSAHLSQVRMAAQNGLTALLMEN